MNKQPIDRIMAAAKACEGTPFHHQGRVAGVGLDCIGLIVVALREAGAHVADRTDYAPRPDGVALIEGIEAHGATRVGDMQAGDVLVFRFDQRPQHVALALGADEMIHAFAPAGKVVRTPLGAYWQRRLVAIYRLDHEELKAEAEKEG